MLYWPAEVHFAKIASRAKGLFIFATTVIHFVDDIAYANPISQLQKVIEVIDSSSPSTTTSFATLNTLYMEILSAVPENQLYILQHLLYERERDLLQPSDTLVDACNFWGITQAEAYSALHKLHSVLIVPQPSAAHNEGLRTHHASFLDHMTAFFSSSNSPFVDSVHIKKRSQERAVCILAEYCDSG